MVLLPPPKPTGTVADLLLVFIIYLWVGRVGQTNSIFNPNIFCEWCKMKMKKSDFFKKTYLDIYGISNSVGEAYHDGPFMDEMNDEQKDLDIPDNIFTFVETALYWYSCRLTRELAASLTETFSGLIEMEDDVNLFDSEVVEKMVNEVEKAMDSDTL